MNNITLSRILHFNCLLYSAVHGQIKCPRTLREIQRGESDSSRENVSNNDKSDFTFIFHSAFSIAFVTKLCFERNKILWNRALVVTLVAVVTVSLTDESIVERKSKFTLHKPLKILEEISLSSDSKI